MKLLISLLRYRMEIDILETMIEETAKPSILRRVLTVLLSLATLCCVILGALWAILNMGIPSSRAQVAGGDIAMMDKYEMYITNQISEALDGILSIKKVYWLNDNDTIAPEPDQTRFGMAEDPDEVLPVLDEAAQLLDIDEFFFRTDVDFGPKPQVRWYLDETIFVVTWQEIHDNILYTFSEVKIAHPSQMRRFLAGDTYGHNMQFYTTQMASDVNAVMASSGDFYKFRSYGIVVYDGQVHRANGKSVDTCFIDDKGDMIMVYAGQITTMEDAQAFVDEHNIRFSISFGPILIEDGVRFPQRYYPIGEIYQNFPRAALCQLGERHYVVAIANSRRGYGRLPSLPQFGDYLLSKGVTTAYTLDGGQTAVLVMNDEMINPVEYGSQRRISDIFYFATALPDGG